MKEENVAYRRSPRRSNGTQKAWGVWGIMSKRGQEGTRIVGKYRWEIGKKLTDGYLAGLIDIDHSLEERLGRGRRRWKTASYGSVEMMGKGKRVDLVTYERDGRGLQCIILGTWGGKRNVKRKIKRTKRPGRSLEEPRKRVRIVVKELQEKKKGWSEEYIFTFKRRI